MARLARVMAPGMPHHVTQRGNRRQQTFFGEEDYQHYLELMSQFCRAEQVAIWAYCLMPNHVHLIVVPQSAESLRRAIGEAHRRYTRRIYFREGWRGHLWQGRFASFVMDEDHLLTAARYVELNPVRAGLVQAPSRYRWSSAAAHLRGRDDVLVQVAPLLQMAPNWRRLLTRAIREGVESLPRARAYRPAARRRELSGAARTESGPDLETPEARPQERASEMSMLSPEALTRDGSDPRWSSARSLVFFDPPKAANRARNSAISTSRVVICSAALSALILHCSRLLARWARRFL